MKSAWSQAKSDWSEIACLTDFIIRVMGSKHEEQDTHPNRKEKRAAPKPQRVPAPTRAIMYTRSKMIFESSFAWTEDKAEINLSVWRRTTWSTTLEFAAAGQSHWPQSPPSLSLYLSHNQDLKLTSTKIFYKWYGIGYNNLGLLACVPSKYSVLYNNLAG